MQTKTHTIGLLTSGGDAPGMNASIRAVVRTAMFNDIQVFGIKNGFEGLINGEFLPLDARSVGGILQRGGTILHTRRSERFMEKTWQREAIRNMNEATMDGLIVIGGDGSMRGAHELALQKFNVIGIPASIDNDIWGTNMAIGVDTALNTIMEAVDKLRDTASSHSRAFLIETMGRGSGYLAVMAGIVCGAGGGLIPGVTTTGEEEENIKINYLWQAIDALDVGFKTRVSILGHIQRGGGPTAFDRLLAARMGSAAINGFLKGQSDVMVGLNGRAIELIPFTQVLEHKRVANVEYYTMARELAR